MIYLELFISFFQIGLFSIGGGYAAMPLIESIVIKDKAWLTMAEWGDLIAIAEMTPGPIAINSATFIGRNEAGLLGAIVATLGNITPSLIIVITLAYLYSKYNQLDIIQDVLGTLRPAVVALIASAGFSILVMTFTDVHDLAPIFSGINLFSVIIFIAAVVGLRLFKPNPIIVMLGSGAFGLVLHFAYGLVNH